MLLGNDTRLHWREGTTYRGDLWERIDSYGLPWDVKGRERRRRQLIAIFQK